MVTLTASPLSVDEAAGSTTVTVTGTLDGAPRSTATFVRVTVGAQGDTAEEVTDYATDSDLTLTIRQGQTSATTTFALTPIDDDVAENDEALSISGSDSSDTEQLPLTVTGTTITIEDDDERVPPSTMVTLTASPLSVDEAAGSTTVTVTGTLDGAPRSTATFVRVTVGAQGDTAEEVTDYATDSDLTLTIRQGQTSATTTFALTPIDDDVAENDEALSISGSDSSDTEQSPLTVTGTTITIEDDDERVPPSTMVTLTASPLSVDEAAGSTTVTVTGTLDGAPRSTATTVTVGAQDDSATEGTDYGTIADFPLTIQAGETTGSATFTFTPINDDVDEDDEVISLSGRTDAEGLSVAGTELTIADEDTPGVELSVSTVAVAEDQSSTYTVRLSTTPDQNVAVTPRSDNPYIVFQPSSLVFDIGNWAAPQEISFEIAAENQQAAVTIEHSISGYGEVTEGGVVTVIVTESPVVDEERQTVHRTVAAVAAATVSNVTSNIGARFSAPTGGATLSFAGTPVAFGPTGSKSLESVTLPSGFGDPDGDRRQARHGTMTGGDLLRSGSFEIALGASQGGKAPMADASNRLTVWGARRLPALRERRRPKVGL